MPSDADRELLTRAFYDDVIWPMGTPRLEDAWLAIYQLLSWYAHGYIHIREANDLKKASWQERARKAEAYVAKALAVKPQEVAAHVDRMMQLPRWKEVLAQKGTTVTCPHCGQDFVLPSEQQRNNSLGNGLRILVAEVLRRWGDPRFAYEEEALARTWFPGIEMPGRSERAKMDVLAHAAKRPAAIVSCKWSARHDRMSDVTNECPQYKRAAISQDIMDLRYFVVTAELDGQRSNKNLEQRCMDGLVMVHLPLAETIGMMTPAMQRSREEGRLLDLAHFVEGTHKWKG